MLSDSFLEPTALEQLGKNSSGDDIRMNAKGALWLLKETVPGQPSAGKKESGQVIGHTTGAPAIPSEGNVAGHKFQISYSFGSARQNTSIVLYTVL